MVRLVSSMAAAVLLALCGCKAGQGDICRCAKDCQDGLVCATGATVLDVDACFEGDKTGECIPDEALPDDTGDIDPMMTFDDMPSKRDLGGDDTDTGGTGTDDTDTGGTGTDDTDTGGTGTDDTDTGGTGTGGF